MYLDSHSYNNSFLVTYHYRETHENKFLFRDTPTANPDTINRTGNVGTEPTDTARNVQQYTTSDIRCHDNTNIVLTKTKHANSADDCTSC